MCAIPSAAFTANHRSIARDGDKDLDHRNFLFSAFTTQDWQSG